MACLKDEPERREGGEGSPYDEETITVVDVLVRAVFDWLGNGFAEEDDFGFCLPNMIRITRQSEDQTYVHSNFVCFQPDNLDMEG